MPTLNRRDFLRASAALGLGAVGAPLFGDPPDGTGTGKRKPNLVFVFTDQQAFHMWSGETAAVHTPHLARMARDGLVFRNCISNNPICVPYRASMLTGCFGQQTGKRWNENDTLLAPGTTTWASVLTANGYACGYVGKWHLYTPRGAANLLLPESKGRPLTPEEQARFAPRPIPREFRYGFDAWWAKTHNYNEHFANKYYDEEGVEHLLEGYGPAASMDLALGFIERNADRPFAVALSVLPPHPPTKGAPEEWTKRYKKATFPERPNVPEKSRGQYQQGMQRCSAHVSAIDASMGKLQAHLEQLGIAEDTIVVFTSDHGFLLNNHGFMHKRWPWDESIRVPFLITYPRAIPAGRTTDALLSTVDLAPSLLGLAGISPPAAMAGLDQSPLMRGEVDGGPESSFIMYIRPPNGNYMTEKVPELRDYRGVRTARFTYTRWRDHQNGKVSPWQLYDNERDPFQLENRVEDPDYAADRHRLAGMLDGWLEQVGETFT